MKINLKTLTTAKELNLQWSQSKLMNDNYLMTQKVQSFYKPLGRWGYITTSQ